MPAPAQTETPPPLAYGIADAAVALSVSQRTIWNFISEGKVRKVRLGRRVLIPAADLQAIAEGRAA